MSERTKTVEHLETDWGKWNWDGALLGDARNPPGYAGGGYDIFFPGTLGFGKHMTDLPGMEYGIQGIKGVANDKDGVSFEFDGDPRKQLERDRLDITKRGRGLLARNMFEFKTYLVDTLSGKAVFTIKWGFSVYIGAKPTFQTPRLMVDDFYQSYSTRPKDLGGG